MFSKRFHHYGFNIYVEVIVCTSLDVCLVVFESVGLGDIHLDSHEICITMGGFAAGVLCWDRGSRFTHWVATMAHGPWVGGVEN